MVVGNVSLTSQLGDIGVMLLIVAKLEVCGVLSSFDGRIAVGRLIVQGLIMALVRGLATVVGGTRSAERPY